MIRAIWTCRRFVGLITKFRWKRVILPTRLSVFRFSDLEFIRVQALKIACLLLKIEYRLSGYRSAGIRNPLAPGSHI